MQGLLTMLVKTWLSAATAALHGPAQGLGAVGTREEGENSAWPSQITRAGPSAASSTATLGLASLDWPASRATPVDAVMKGCRCPAPSCTTSPAAATAFTFNLARRHRRHRQPPRYRHASTHVHLIWDEPPRSSAGQARRRHRQQLEITWPHTWVMPNTPPCPSTSRCPATLHMTWGLEVAAAPVLDGPRQRPLDSRPGKAAPRHSPARPPDAALPPRQRRRRHRPKRRAPEGVGGAPKAYRRTASLEDLRRRVVPEVRRPLRNARGVSCPCGFP